MHVIWANVIWPHKAMISSIHKLLDMLHITWIYYRGTTDLKLSLFPEKQGHTYNLSSVRSPDQILAQSSEVCLGKSGGYISASNFSNQFTVDNVLRPQAAPVGLMRSNYLSKSYSFAGNSGSPLLGFTTLAHL